MPNSPFTPEQISQILEEFFKAVGTRQYIGARYVPIFGRKGEQSIQWDNTKPYEPLTIVLYQGDSYTSRQYVPEGVDITNELFWALTGNYNAQIEAYRREVQGFGDRIDAVESSDLTQNEQLAGTATSGLKDLITENTEHLADIDEQLAGTTDSGLRGLIGQNAADILTHTNQLAGNESSGLKTLITQVQSKIASDVIIIGDSYGTGYNPGGATITDTCFKLFKDWCTSIGITCYDKAVGGHGFGVSAKPYNTLLNNVITGLNAEQKRNVRTVFFVGGYNDCGHVQSEITAGMNDCKATIRANLPNATRVIIVPVGMAVEGLTSGVHADFTYQMAANMYMRYILASVESGLGAVVPGSNMALRKNTLFASDYVHPNADGHNNIYAVMKDAFIIGHSDAPRRSMLQYSVNVATASKFASGALQVTARGQSPVTIELANVVLEYATAVASYTLSVNTQISLGTYTDALIQPYSSFKIPALVNIRYDTNHYYVCMAYVQFANGDITLKPIAANTAHSNFETLSGMDRLSIYPLSHVAIDNVFLR